MTEDDKKFFEDARDLFLTTGWANFKAELEVAINQIHVANCEDEKDSGWLRAVSRSCRSC
jgi:hypothetical protein